MEHSESSVTISEASEQFYNDVSRLTKLGQEAIKISQALENGKEIKPQALKKLGGRVKWWANQCFWSHNICDAILRGHNIPK